MMQWSGYMRAARDHVVLETVRRGQALVVRPLGDLPGYSPTAFRGELRRVQKLAEDPRIKHIICDFSHSAYFSQEMVVPLLALREPLDERGKLVMCGLSDEMRTLMEHTEGGADVIQYDDRPSAIDDLSGESIFTRSSEWMNLHPKSTLAIAALVLTPLVLLLAYTVDENPFDLRSPAEQLYDALADEWEEAVDLEASGASREDWRDFARPAGERVFDLLVQMRETEGRDDADNAVMRALVIMLRITEAPEDRVRSMAGQFTTAMDMAREQLAAKEIAVDRVDTLKPRGERGVTIDPDNF